ncbi:(2Fe-2S)-binding protein, partial [Clostridium saudiense]|nr:(2Fe-2S)-binding protein [Clostridium saudiense]MBM6861484.1 (2Fe-2S)-binding protein [Clostridium saudiense]
SRSEGYLTGEFLKENTDIGVQYIIGKIKVASKDMPDRGKGKIVNIDKSKFGVYRDYEDIFHIVDTTCTHMGCELKWNSLEKSWDCPCHGSRFGIDGDILEGPATIPLKQYGSETYNEINPNLI